MKEAELRDKEGKLKSAWELNKGKLNLGQMRAEQERPSSDQLKVE